MKLNQINYYRSKETEMNNKITRFNAHNPKSRPIMKNRICSNYSLNRPNKQCIQADKGTLRGGQNILGTAENL